MFAIIAVPFDAYAALPRPEHRWLLTCLARYTDPKGHCWPSMRQLACDARMSLASVCRYLKSMADLGVFQRERKGVGRYVYTLAEAYIPRWPTRVSAEKRGVSGAGTQEAKPLKHGFIRERFAHEVAETPWAQRIQSWLQTQFWLAGWGPRPDEPGCIARSFCCGLPSGMTDARPTDDRWLTYIEAGELLGLSPEAVRSIARRQKWPRQSPNAIGKVVRVLVPADRLRPVVDRRERPVATNGHDRSSDRSAELREMAELFIRPLREQLERAEQRAQAAEARVREMQEQMAAEMIEHRRVIGLLAERIPERRHSWWPWRRRT